MIKIIAAVGNYVPEKGFPIGKDGSMPWHCKADLDWFRATTEGKTVVMGRNTYRAIGEKPLPNRDNYIVSNSLEKAPDGFSGILRSVGDIVGLSGEKHTDVYVIGGAELYKSVLEEDIVDEILIDFIDASADDADTFFPNIDFNENFDFVRDEPLQLSEDGYSCRISVLKHKRFDNDVDDKYLNLVQEILTVGETKETRAGTARSLFGKQLRFDLKKGLPILTTKRVYTNGIIHELIWFLKGDTNIKYLVDNNVHIWDDDAYRYYLELIGKNNATVQESSCLPPENWKINITEKEPLAKDVFIEEVKKGSKMWVVTSPMVGIMSYYPNDYCFEYTYGDLGPVYGKQWRNWHGVNQIKNVIEALKTNPDDRRMVVSAWNVSEIGNMALPPCHYSFQFYTKKIGIKERMDWAAEHDLNCWDEASLDANSVPSRKLSCMFSMRSVDSVCGLPFNIASYAILTHMVAQCCNMEADELVFNGGDVHIYENHIDAFREQLNRDRHRYALPKLELNPHVRNIDEFRAYDINIVGYKSYPAIKYQLNTGL